MGNDYYEEHVIVKGEKNQAPLFMIWDCQQNGKLLYCWLEHYKNENTTK